MAPNAASPQPWSSCAELIDMKTSPRGSDATGEISDSKVWIHGPSEAVTLDLKRQGNSEWRKNPDCLFQGKFLLPITLWLDTSPATTEKNFFLLELGVRKNQRESRGWVYSALLLVNTENVNEYRRVGLALIGIEKEWRSPSQAPKRTKNFV